MSGAVGQKPLDQRWLRKKKRENKIEGGKKGRFASPARYGKARMSGQVFASRRHSGRVATKLDKCPQSIIRTFRSRDGFVIWRWARVFRSGTSRKGQRDEGSNTCSNFARKKGRECEGGKETPWTRKKKKEITRAGRTSEGEAILEALAVCQPRETAAAAFSFS